MGGTSTDVSRFEGTVPEMIYEAEIDGIDVQMPHLHIGTFYLYLIYFIETVAAGGGSRLFFENDLMRVGPESSGASPGPVCYGKNGYLSITDANLILGNIH